MLLTILQWVPPDSPAAPTTNSISATEKPWWKTKVACSYCHLYHYWGPLFHYSLWMVVFTLFPSVHRQSFHKVWWLVVCLWETSYTSEPPWSPSRLFSATKCQVAKCKGFTILFLFQLKSPLLFLSSSTPNPFSQCHGPGTWRWSLRGLNSRLSGSRQHDYLSWP